MALADIKKKQKEERKREKRLVHFTNSVSHAFLNSKSFESKNKAYKNTGDYVAKSFLDYLFFEQHKEIHELHEDQVNQFILDYASRKLTFTTTSAKYVGDILANFLEFLDAQGHINNGTALSNILKNNRQFLKQITKKKIPIAKTTTKKKMSKKLVPEVGRNDPCPCGSGKKYKKCCGRPK